MLTRNPPNANGDPNWTGGTVGGIEIGTQIHREGQTNQIQVSGLCLTGQGYYEGYGDSMVTFWTTLAADGIYVSYQTAYIEGGKEQFIYQDWFSFANNLVIGGYRGVWTQDSSGTYWLKQGGIV